MNISNVTRTGLFAATLAAASVTSALGAVGCTADTAPPSTTQAKETSTQVEAGASAAAIGVARYAVSVGGPLTNIAVLDAKGSELASIVSYGITGGRHVSYSRGSVNIELEYASGTLSAWVNGQSRGSAVVDAAALTSGKVQGGALDLADVSHDASLLLTVSGDASLQQALAALRGGDSPDMFSLEQCSGHVVVACAVATFVPPTSVEGVAVCTYCAIAWL